LFPVEDEIQSGLLSFYEKKSKLGGGREAKDVSEAPLWKSIEISNFTKISDGWENEVYSFILGYEGTAGRKFSSLILRIYPGDNAHQKAAREFNGMKRLYELGFPVPEVLVLELDDSLFGKPFVIMEKIDGRLMGSIIAESTDEKKQELIALFCSIFADLHALDWRPFAPDPSVYETGDPYTFINHWLLYAQRYGERFQRSEFNPVLDWLKERSLYVPCERLSVVHMDYHPYNVLMRDDGRVSIIDWTNIDVADFRLDLAWTILLTSTYGNPEARGIILDEYEQIVGYKIQQIEYFEVAASLRRLLSISVSLSNGADKLGMRPEAVASMKQSVNHIGDVYSVLHDRTGINIPEIETLISTLS
jgi:aminoglycoside phosphotransferase (APT) family kinase protein